ncbi:MAG: response regulator transcription factor [Spirochaetaceae bacterium]
MANILIIEDEVKIANAISAYLKNSGHTAFIELNGKSGLSTFSNRTFDLIVLDLMLPDLKGEEICSYIRSRSRVPIIMLTAKSDEISQIHGFRIGADDFITKPFSPRVLMVRIEALLRRHNQSPLAQLIEFDSGRIKIDTKNSSLTKDKSSINLTPIEFSILKKLISSPNRVFSREEIIHGVMGPGFDGTDRTIDSHIRNLRYKIEDDPKNPSYISTSRGRGFYFNEK